MYAVIIRQIPRITYVSYVISHKHNCHPTMQAFEMEELRPPSNTEVQLLSSHLVSSAISGSIQPLGLHLACM